MRMLKIAICLSCGSDKIKKVRRNWAGCFKGKKYTVPHLRYYECQDCGEKVYDRDTMRDFETHSPAFERLYS
ncbi:MAG: YgiT-type zinc finger protein, partial [Candidatus Binatia bacterium]